MKINISISRTKVHVGDVGDLVEFLNDRLVEQGPCTGKVVNIEGNLLTIRISDNIVHLDTKKEQLKAGRLRYWSVE